MFFLKTVICDFIVLALVWNSVMILPLYWSPQTWLYQIYQHFKITIKSFLYLINFVESLLSTVLVFFMWLHKWLRYLFPLHGFHLPTSLISGKTALIPCHFEFLLFLKPIIGMSGHKFSIFQHRQELNVIVLIDFSDIDIWTLNVDLLSFYWLLPCLTGHVLQFFLPKVFPLSLTWKCISFLWENSWIHCIIYQKKQHQINL